MADFGAVLDAGLRVFGIDVTYTAPGSSTAQSVRGVFDAEHEEIDLGTGVPVSSVGPVIGIKLADFDPEPVQDGTFVIQGKTYSVVDVRPDGQGGAELPLHEVKGG